MIYFDSTKNFISNNRTLPKESRPHKIKKNEFFFTEKKGSNRTKERECINSSAKSVNGYALVMIPTEYKK
jgi:hypothetical protein